VKLKDSSFAADLRTPLQNAFICNSIPANARSG
jgi:hypothetical protein